MDLEMQNLFVTSALHFAISGTLNLNNDQLINMYEECSVKAGSLKDIGSFILAHQMLAKLSFELSRFDKALRSNTILLSIFRRNRQRKLEANTFCQLGKCYHYFGQYNKAKEHHEMSLKIARQIGDKAGEGNAYGNLGIYYHSLGHFDKAVKHLEMCLNIAKELGDKIEEENACINLGISYHSLGQYEKAVKHQEMSLNIARQIGDKAGEGRVYGNLGSCFHSLGQYDQAVEHYNISLNISNQIGDKILEGRVYGNLGNCYLSFGEYDKAVKHNRMSLNIARQIGDKATEGTAYDGLGSCYNSLQQYDRAVKHLEMSLNIAKELGDRAREGSSYCNLGNCYISLGQYDKAVKYYEMSLNIFMQIGDKAGEGNLHCNLGNCYESLGQCDKAIKHHEMSLNIARQIRDKATEGKAFGNLGNCYHSLRQYDKAAKHHKMSLNIAREIGNKTGEGTINCNLGNCYLFLGRYNKAEKRYEMSLSIAKQIGDKELEAKVYVNLGTCYCSLGQYDKAVCNLKEGLKCFENTFQNTPQKDEVKISVREAFSKSYGTLVNVLIEQEKTNEALVVCERGRARALIDLMHFTYFLHDYKTQQILLDLADVRRLVTSLQSTVLYFALANDCIFIWIIGLNGCIHFKKSSLPAQRKDQDPNEAFAPFSERVSSLISKFRSSCLPIECEDRSLPETKQNDKKSCSKLGYSCVAPNAEVNKKYLFAKECTAESSDKDTLFRNPFSDEEDAETSALQKLHQFLLAPVQDHIEGKEIVIVPEGSLHLVPFAALMDEDGHYVSESLRVRLFPSLTTAKMILENDFEPNEQMKPLIVGDPDTGYLQRLPCANKEAQIVSKLFNTEPLIGGEATKEKVLLSIANASLIHIAAHGKMERGEIALARNPTETSTSTEKNQEDNMLMMADLEKKRLKAKLVVLSCCHSARGKITSEGVVGIARAFLGAGARSVLVALWAINDGATLYFMERFYEHLTQGKSAGESLNEAMAAMKASGKYNDPRHWAPFVLIGDDVSVC